MRISRLKLLLIKSDGKFPERHKPFTTFYDDHYARRFMKHLKDDPSLCTGCGDKCVNCRARYKLNISEKITSIIELPSTLPYYLENPEKFIPVKMPEHDVLVAINIHEEIILSLPPRMAAAGGKALIVPSEHPDWVSRWLRIKVGEAANQCGIEAAFPKPFCDLTAEAGTVVADFIKEFRIGRPKLKINHSGDKIESVDVQISAPCGCTYFLAHNIKGAKLDEDFINKVSKYWHSYPCTASMKMDYEIGDTILHKGGYIHREAVQAALQNQP